MIIYNPTKDDISRAADILKEIGVVVNNQYPSVFKGYVSAFGASIAQCGILATLIVFESTDSEAEGRQLLPEAIRRFLKIEDKALSVVCNERAKDIENASVAFKVALRMFEDVDKKKLLVSDELKKSIGKLPKVTSLTPVDAGSKNMGHEFQFNNIDVTKWNVKKTVAINKQLIESYFKNNGFTTFTLKVAAPGLLIGSGLAHGTDSKDDFKVGMQFDHTTGLPIIPGSSVKGMLKAYFQEFVKEFAKDFSRLKDMEKPIFEGGKDIFADALLTKATSKGNVVGQDYITPHYPNLLEEPTPIKILKVLPNAEFTFCFKLSGTPEIVNQKKECFKKILTTVGIGAKTNVGYGRLKE